MAVGCDVHFTNHRYDWLIDSAICSRSSCPRVGFLTECLSVKLCPVHFLLKQSPVTFTVHLFIISSLSSLQLAHHPILLLSERREAQASADRIDVVSLLHLSPSFSLRYSSPKPPPSSLCVLPHGFPLQQCVALVITSCLKQTDGIRESDGQFSQCLFSPCMCTQLFPCVCVLYARFFSFRHLLLTPPPPSLPVSLPLCTADVCLCECVQADVGNYLTECVSSGWEWDRLISCCCVGQVSLLGAPGGIAAVPSSSLFSPHAPNTAP